MPTEKPRCTVSFNEDMFKEIEDFRFNNRFNSRSEAVVELIRIGLEKLKEEQKDN